MKMHYRKVKRDIWGYLSITVPCGSREAKVISDTTKEKENVTCKTCLNYLKKNER